MGQPIEEMLAFYEAHSAVDRKNAIKEVMQEIALCGLSRAGFFDQAAFYGGTALRIFYGFDRFSEDLNFSLMQPNRNFQLSSYIPTLEKEMRSFGLNRDVQDKASLDVWSAEFFKQITEGLEKAD